MPGKYNQQNVTKNEYNYRENRSRSNEKLSWNQELNCNKIDLDQSNYKNHVSPTFFLNFKDDSIFKESKNIMHSFEKMTFLSKSNFNKEDENMNSIIKEITNDKNKHIE